MARAGELIDGRYRLERKIGSGAMGGVWLAEHVTLETPVAIKLIHFEAARSARSLARFRREAVIAVKIQSAHVAKVLDHGEHDELPYIVMEYLEGESLRSRLDRERRLSVAATAKMLRHVSRALTRAHQLGLVHRDIKPENVFVTQVDFEETYKVLDFGVAKVTDELARTGMDPTRTGALVGTPYYLSPEQARGLKSVDHRADLWSMAVLTFECLTGQRPFRGAAMGPLIAQIIQGRIPIPSQAAPEARLPAEIDAWMAKGLTRDPSGRFASAKEAADAFTIAAGESESLPLPHPNSAATSTSPRDVSVEASAPELSELDQTVSLAETASAVHTAQTLALEPSSLAATMAIPDGISHGQNGGDPPGQRWPTAATPRRERKWIAGLAALLVVAAAGAGAFMLTRSRPLASSKVSPSMRAAGPDAEPPLAASSVAPAAQTTSAPSASATPTASAPVTPNGVRHDGQAAPSPKTSSSPFSHRREL